MPQSKTLKGFFYLPSHPDDVVPGILTIEPYNSIELELFGKFKVVSDLFDSQKNKANIEDIILGNTLETGKITLWNKIVRTARMKGSALITRYAFQYCFNGIHLESKDQNCFDYCDIELDELLHLRRPNLIEHIIENQDKNTKSITVKADVSENERDISCVKIHNDTTLILRQGVNFKSKHPEEEYSFSQETYVTIIKENTSDLKSFLHDIRVFEQFTSLFSLSSVVCNNIKLYKKDHYHHYKSNSEKKVINLPITLFQSNYANLEAKKPKAHEYLFYYDNIEDIFEETLQKWYSDSQSAYPIKQHLINSLNQSNVFTSLDFLIVMQALEGYASRFDDAGEGFAKNIQYLIDSFQDIDKVKNTDFEVNIAVNSRNYYSHFFNKKKTDRYMMDMSYTC